jgi:hypothetical protein
MLDGFEAVINRTVQLYNDVQEAQAKLFAWESF